jgi:hypothetical protein
MLAGAADDVYLTATLHVPTNIDVQTFKSLTHDTSAVVEVSRKELWINSWPRDKDLIRPSLYLTSHVLDNSRIERPSTQQFLPYINPYITGSLEYLRFPHPHNITLTRHGHD